MGSVPCSLLVVGGVVAGAFVGGAVDVGAVDVGAVDAEVLDDGAFAAESAAVDPDEQETPRAGATHMLSDNGVEETSEVSGMSSSLQNLASNRSRLKGVTRRHK